MTLSSEFCKFKNNFNIDTTSTFIIKYIGFDKSSKEIITWWIKNRSNKKEIDYLEYILLKADLKTSTRMKFTKEDVLWSICVYKSMYMCERAKCE